MKKIAFFLSANDLSEIYSKPALELVRLSVESGYGFVYGGTSKGLMNQAADFVASLNGHITAILSKEFVYKLKKGANKTFIAENLGERKRLLLENSDAIIAL